MKKKNKKYNLKRILTLVVTIIIITISILILIGIKNRNDKNGVFSILEKRRIEKNKSDVINVSIINDLPIFGSEGDGVFFDFLKDFEKETSIKVNMIPYSIQKSVNDKGYSFQVTDKSVLNENELLFYTDNYVMISKDSEKVKKISDLENTIIGVLETDLSTVKEHLNVDSSVIYNTYNNIDTLIAAIKNNDIKYAIIPKNIYLDVILKDNYYIVYNISDIYTNYTFNINGEEKVLNNIFNKFYIRWMKEKYADSYNSRLLSLYMNVKGIDEISKADFNSKDYVYGYVKNVPYESEINGDFIGFNSEILDDFASSMNISFKISEFDSIEELTRALNDGKVDVAFNYYKFNNLNNKVDYTFSVYDEKVVVLSSINNIKTTASSFKSLKDKEVLMIDNKIANYIDDKTDIKINKFNTISSLFSSMNDDYILIMDYNT